MSAADCTCPGGPNDRWEGEQVACIAGTVYGPCTEDVCGGVCESEGRCDCLLHASPTHDCGYGGTYSD